MAAPASQEKAAPTTRASAEFFWGHLPSVVALPWGHKGSRQVKELFYDTLCLGQIPHFHKRQSKRTQVLGPLRGKMAKDGQSIRTPTSCPHVTTSRC